jgi:hypothetical protein
MTTNSQKDKLAAGRVKHEHAVNRLFTFLGLLQTARKIRKTKQILQALTFHGHGSQV